MTELKKIYWSMKDGDQAAIFDICGMEGVFGSPRRAQRMMNALYMDLCRSSKNADKPVLREMLAATATDQFLATVQPQKHQPYKKFQNWKLPDLTGAVVVVGDSNLKAVVYAPEPDTQVISFPGMKPRHLTHLLRQYEGPHPITLILSLGINCRDQDYIRTRAEFDTLRSVVHAAFPQCVIYIQLTWWSSSLHGDYQTTMEDLYIYLQQTWQTIPTVIDTDDFQIDEEDKYGIHVTYDTAQAIASKW